MFCYVSQLHVDRFSQDFYNRDSFDEMIKMRGNSPMQISKLHALWNILAPCQQIFHKTFITAIVLMRWLKWGSTTLCELQNCIFCEISWLHVDGFSQDFYNRDSLMRWLKWGATGHWCPRGLLHTKDLLPGRVTT